MVFGGMVCFKWLSHECWDQRFIKQHCTVMRKSMLITSTVSSFNVVADQCICPLTDSLLQCLLVLFLLNKA